MNLPSLKIVVYFLLMYSVLNRDRPGDNIRLAIQHHLERYPQEKIYLQTDKAAYLDGQTIWFKLYTTAFGAPTELSKLAYVQLLDPAGKVLLQNKLPLVGGMAEGSMLLPDSLSSRLYQLRCFTSWMLNFEEESICHKRVFIKNASDSSSIPHDFPSAIAHYQLQFFPEGGDLVESNLSNLAFRATDQYGLPAEIRGELTDDQDKVIADFRSVHDGMGQIPIRPLVGHHYRSRIHFPDSSIQIIVIPEAQPFGITLRVLDQTVDRISVQLNYHEEEKGQFQDIVLAAFQNSGKVTVYPLQLERGNNVFDIPVKDFSPGILRLTVFDKNDLPRSERIVFLEKQDRIKLQLDSDSLSFKNRSKSSFILRADNLDWKLDKLSLSISVTDADRVAEDTLADNIYSAIFLSSELKGVIHNPAFYFRENDKKTSAALDLLMLTNGWRHFQWHQLLTGQEPTFSHPVEKSLNIAGKILGYKWEKGKEDARLKMVIENQDLSKFMGQVYPDSNGEFILRDYDRTGNSTVYFQGTGKSNKERNLKVRFYEPPIDTMRYVSIAAIPAEYLAMPAISRLWLDENTENASSPKYRELKAVLVKKHILTAKEIVAKKYVSPLFQAAYFHELDLINEIPPSSIRIFDFLKGRFPGLGIGGDENHPLFEFRGSATQHFMGTNGNNADEPSAEQGAPPTSYPYFYVDEIRTPYVNIKEIPLDEIALIRFIPPPAPMAPLGGAPIGVISIYLKKWDERPAIKGVGDSYGRYLFRGYSVTREFASPNYSRPDSIYSKPDLRTTLYWDPRPVVDSSGKLHFSFYNSDHAKRFRVVAEGMDQQGRVALMDVIVQ